MIKFYVMQIKLGKITVGDVPDRFRAQVEEMLLQISPKQD